MNTNTKSDDIATFEVWQDGMRVAGVSGPREQAEREANHYALIYGQDGPVSIKELKPRRKSGTERVSKVCPNEETEGLALKAIRLTLDKAAEAIGKTTDTSGVNSDGQSWRMRAGKGDYLNNIRSISPEDILKELK